MRTFAYEAVDEAGLVSRGELRAADELQLEEVLARRGLTLVRFLLLRTWAKRDKAVGRLRRADVVEFARYVSVTSKAGLSIVDSMDDFATRCPDPRFRKVITKIAADVRGGLPMSDAFARPQGAFDPVFISMVRAGEASGTLDSSMHRAASQMEFQLSVRNQIRSALVPPAILAVALTGLVILLITFLLPRLMGVMSGTGVVLPLPTRILLSISDALTGHWLLILGGLASLFAGLHVALSRPAVAHAASRLVLKLPGVGPLVRMSAEARFASTMQSLLASGVDAVRALQMAAATTGSTWMAERLEQVARQVQGGESLAGSIGCVEGLHPLLQRMLQLGEKSGNLQQTLGTAVDFYASEIPRGIKRAMQLIEPAIVIVAGATIAFIVLATILPIFALYDSMS